jgi:solute carrier family 25 carnitine/acylcarnitine transporter 20/29
MSSWQDEHISAGIRDFLAGTLSGVAGVIAGHPLDTIRVRMQVSKVGTKVSTKDVYTSMVSNEGVRLRLELDF